MTDFPNMIFVLACSGSKADVEQAPAGDLYTGAIFKKGKDVAQQHGVPFVILSAKYGLVRPTTVIETYNERFKGKGNRPCPPAPWHGFYVGGQDYFSRYPKPRFEGLVPPESIGYMLQKLTYLQEHPEVVRAKLERKQREWHASL